MLSESQIIEWKAVTMMFFDDDPAAALQSTHMVLINALKKMNVAHSETIIKDRKDRPVSAVFAVRDSELITRLCSVIEQYDEQEGV